MTSSFALFLAASLALTLTPGPAVLYIVARSVDQGRWAGVVSALGVGVGTLVHVAAAAAGLSALLLSSATAFLIVKYLGAAYLVFLGLKKLLGREEDAPQAVTGERGLLRAFLQGIFVNVLNPKTALFFFAFLPQFVDPARGSVAAQTLFLGTCFTLLGVTTDSLYALASGSASQWIRSRPGFRRTQCRLTGGVYVGLGVATALARSK